MRRGPPTRGSKRAAYPHAHRATRRALLARVRIVLTERRAATKLGGPARTIPAARRL